MKDAGKFKSLETNKKNYPFDIKKYLTLRNILVVLVLVFFYFLYPRFVQPIILIIIFYPISLFSARLTKYVKFLNTETITSFTVFLGYVYGWQWALFFGFGLGFYIWSQTALNQLTIVNCFTYIFAAYFGYMASHWFPGNFLLGYIVAVTIKNIISFLIFIFFNPSLFENISHTIAEVITNTILMPVFLSILYNIIISITPT